MHCYTLPIGGVPERGIRIAMTPGHEVPVVVVGPIENGAVVPVAQTWYDRMVELRESALALPECKNKTLGLPHIMHCELEGIRPQDFVLHSRPGDENDRRVLVHLVPPEGERVRYSGCYKLESYKEETGKVTSSYPRIEDVVGIQYIAGYEGEILIIMDPGAGFRVTRPRKTGVPDFHMYRLTAGGHKPRIIDLTPRRMTMRAA